MKLNYHNVWLNVIKRDLRASFVAFEKYNNNYRLKVIVDNTVVFRDLSGEPSDITDSSYSELFDDLKIEFYGKL